ncbi:MAG TPA: ComF family protein [Syntrophaceae bacterium]|nr:ComF family protein [Syntrophaceae bacterium]
MSIKDCWEAFLDLIFPPKCLVCHVPLEARDNYQLCPSCLSGITFIKPPFCTLCGMPFKSQDSLDHLCGECLTSKRYFTKARSVGFYEGTLLKAIHLFKYHRKIHLALPLGYMLSDSVSQLFHMEWVDLLIPVPLHHRRLRERGFNQALLLARILKKRYNKTLATRVLRRWRWTEPQVNLSEKARKNNVKGSFVISNHMTVKEKNILLLDDVYTTGATINECGRTLLKAGANKVYVLTLARSVRV